MAADFGGQKVDLAREADFRLGRITVRPSIRQIELQGVFETLEPRIMQVLVALARKRGQVVSREELIETCWDGRDVGNDPLNRCISKVRKLSELKGGFRLETIPRVGYRLRTEDVAEPIESMVSDSQAPVAAKAPVQKPPVWLRLPALSGIVIAIIALTAAVWLSSPMSGRAAQRVAVFGFTAADTNPISTTIADETTDRTFSELTRNHIEAAARADTINTAARDRLTRAKSLNAAYALSGEVRTEGDRARIIIRLEDPGARTTLWEVTETAPVARQFYSPPGQAAFRAANSVGCVMTARAELSNETPAALRAIMAYCSDRADLDAGRAAARTLAEFEPHSAFFKSLLAMQLLTFSVTLPANMQAEYLTEASALSAEALKLGPGDPYSVAVATLAQGLRGGSPLEAERLLNTVKPGGSPQGQGFLYFWRGLELLGVGRTAEGIGQLRKAEAVQPALPAAWSFHAYGLASLGQTADAEALFEQAFAREPGGAFLWRHWVNAAVLDGVGDPDAVIAAAPETMPEAAVACPRTLLAAKRGAANGVSEIMRVCGVVPTVDATLDRFRALRGPDLHLLMFLPSSRAARAHPRFLPLTKELGLWDYWIATGSHPDVCDLPAEKAFQVCVELRKAQVK